MKPLSTLSNLSRTLRQFSLGLLLSAAVFSATAQLQTAGTVFVNLDVTALPAGPVTDITNTGTLGGYFEGRATNNSAATGSIVLSTNNVTGVNLTGNFVMQLRSSTNGPLIPPPGGIVGNNATASIEVWAMNPSVAADETMVSWGKRGFASQNMNFGYGTDANLGAVTHGTTPDLAWDPIGGSPLNSVWHHLVYTYNGVVESVYVDGALVNSKTGTINIATNAGIMLGQQWTNVAGVDIINVTNPFPATLVVGRVRIHDGALTAAQVFNNYTVEKATFQPAPLVPQFLTSGPVHRYSFNEPDTNNATGLVIRDSVGSANGAVRGTSLQTGAQFARGRLILPASETATNAGPQMRAAYGDLPNGLISVNSTNNGGTGEVSLEIWYKNTGAIASGRVFDIGSCGLATGSVGVEVTDVASRPIGDSALDYLFYSASVGAAQNQRRLAWQNKDTLPAGTFTNAAALTSDSFTMYTHQTDRHLVVTWKELATNSLVIAYENGQRVASLSISNSIASLNDVNVWLGRSMLTDPEFAGEFDEVRFYSYVLAPAQVVGDFQAGPNTINLSEQTPTVITPPQSTTVFQGAPVSFTVQASGSPAVTYQWQKNGSNIPSATNSTYSIGAATLPASTNDVYACTVGNITSTATNSVTSSGATLTVIPNQAPPAQFLHETRDGNRDNYNLPSAEVGGLFKSGANPVMVTHLGYYDLNNDGLVRDHRVGIFNAGGTNLLVSVTVPTGTGAFLTNGYRWVALNPPFIMAPGTTYILEGETFSSSGDGWPDVFAPGFWNPYFVGANDGTTRQGRFNGAAGFGGNPTSLGAANSMYAAPNLASIPVGPAIAYIPQTAVTNYSGASLTVQAFVNGDLPVTVQWYKSPSTLLPSQTNSTLFIPVLTLGDAGDYYVVANNSSGPVQSANVTVTVLPGVPVTIAQSPSDLTAPEGYSASFTVVAAGTPPFFYQWRRNGANIQDATNDTVTIPVTTLSMSGDTYSCVVSNIADSVLYSATSGTATLTVQPNKALPTQFLHEQHDGNRDDYTGNVGGSFQVGATDALVTHLGYYDYNSDGLVRDHHVGIFNSDGTLLVQVDVPSGSDPYLANGYRWVALSSIFVMTNNTTYYVGAEVFSGDGDAWPDVFVPQNWNPYFVGATPASTRVSHFAGGAWPVNPTSGSGANSRYAAGSVAVLPIGAPFGSIQPTNVVRYTGDSVTFTALVNGQAPLTEQWYKAPSTLLAGQTNLTLTLSGLTTADSGDYYLQGNNPVSTAPSASVHLTVYALTPPVVTQQPQAVTVDWRQRAIFTVAAIGQQPITNQWLFQGSPIPGATGTTLTVNNVTTPNVGDYSVVLSNALGSTNSTAAHLSVLPAPTNSFAAAIVEAQPVLYYRFSEIDSSGTAYNQGGLGVANNGTYEGTTGPTDGPLPPTFLNFETTNRAAYFDRNGFGVATGDVAIPALNLDTTSGAHCTLAAWINSASAQTPYAGIIFNRGVAGANGLGVKTNAVGQDVLEYHWNNTYYTFDTGLLVPVGQWVFVALVVEPTKATFYLYNNGVLQTATNIAAHTAVPFQETSYVGWDTSGARRFYGAIDEAMIFNRSLTTAQVTSLYTAATVQSIQFSGALSNHQIILNWSAGVLQRATNVAGPYVDDPSATSPYTITPSGALEFYRVHGQ